MDSELRAIELRRAGRFDEATDILEEALQAGSDSLAIRMELGSAYLEASYENGFERSTLSSAQKAFERAMRMRPDYYGSYLAAADVQYRLNETEAALALLCKADELESADEIVNYRMGLILRDLGRLEDAAAALRTAIAAHDVDEADEELIGVHLAAHEALLRLEPHDREAQKSFEAALSRIADLELGYDAPTAWPERF